MFFFFFFKYIIIRKITILLFYNVVKGQKIRHKNINTKSIRRKKLSSDRLMWWLFGELQHCCGLHRAKVLARFSDPPCFPP